MSAPDGIDERFSTLVGELRSGEATASPKLRERVRAIARRRPEPPATRLRARLPRRRLTLLLAPACALVAAAVGVGVFTSGTSPQKQRSLGAIPGVAHDRGVPAKVARGEATLHASPTRSTRTYSPGPYAPPSGSRAQNYSVDLTLRVANLSDTTRQAINLTRGWGGYVVTVDAGADRKAGTAYIVVRIPIVKIQPALQKLTGLGTILADHVSIQDVQVQLNQRFSRMQALRVRITSLRQKLTDPTLTQSQRAFFEAAIAQRQAALANLEQRQTAQKTRTSFATVSLDLQTKRSTVTPPAKPRQSQIGRALHNIGRVLVVEAEVLLYVLLIGAPFAALALLLWLTRRGLRRRSEEELLAR